MAPRAGLEGSFARKASPIPSCRSSDDASASENAGLPLSDREQPRQRLHRDCPRKHESRADAAREARHPNSPVSQSAADANRQTRRRACPKLRIPRARRVCLAGNRDARRDMKAGPALRRRREWERRARACAGATAWRSVRPRCGPVRRSRSYEGAAARFRCPRRARGRQRRASDSGPFRWQAAQSANCWSALRRS